ncbi:MAG TPA: flagellar motor switch protein FliN, partial [Thioalkalivibrio sp.]|nr:flagellar motor switch protein FliN [Thioalkalivibrio sp.]
MSDDKKQDSEDQAGMDDWAAAMAEQAETEAKPAAEAEAKPQAKAKDEAVQKASFESLASESSGPA